MSEDWSDVPAIPVFPNWSSSLVDRYEFRTTIFEAHTGDEQRRATRQRPRRSIQYAVTASGETLRNMAAMLTLRRDTRLKVPDVTKSTLVEVSGANEITLLEGYRDWMVVGQYVFMREGSRYEVCRIAEFDGFLRFEEGLIHEYTNPRLSPARFGRVPPQQKTTYLTSVTGQTTMLLDLDPGHEEDFADAAPTQFRGQDTMFLRPNWKDGVAVTVGVPGDKIDYGVGQIAFDYRQTLNTKIVEFTFLGRARDEVRKHLNQFHRTKGRRGVFYIPTWTSDFEMVGTPDYGDNTITVRGTYRQELNPIDFSHRNIALIWGDTVVPCGIYSVEPVAEGLKLKIDTPLGSLPLPPKFFLSWLVMARFASDEMVIDWKTDTVAEISYNVAVMRESFFEIAIGGYRMVIGGDYVLAGSRVD